MKLTPMNIFGGLVIIAVIGVVIGGFIATGSPNKNRLIKLDNEKVIRLNNLNYEISNYFNDKQKLPNVLSDLPVSELNNDPQINKPFEYKILDKNKFELCADFNLASKDPNPRLYYASKPPPFLESDPKFAIHQQGRNCFQNTTTLIDANVIPPPRMIPK